MIFLSAYKQLSPLDEVKILELATIIGMNRPPKYYREFCENTDNTFYEFFYELLIDQDARCAFELDWKWHPSDVFGHLEQYFHALDVKLVNIGEDPDYRIYDVKYSVGDKTYIAQVDDYQPSHLLSDIENHLGGKRIISIHFGEDSYAYLIVSNDLDVERFMSITGLERTKPGVIASPQPRYDTRHPNLALNYKQPQKIFFLPNIIYVEDDRNGYFFCYKKSDSNATVTYNHPVWAGRVLPGQTVKEGIAFELESELGYRGRFDYAFAGYESTIKDKQGKDVHRYKLTILLYDKSFSDTTRSGYKVDLQKMTGFSTGLLPLYKT